MNRSNLQYSINKKLQRRLIMVIILFVVFLSTFLICKTVGAQKCSTRTKTVTSICIQKGDSLWSIAEEYITDECGTMEDYIEEIKKTNHLIDDKIHAGNYIIVPYYKESSSLMYACGDM